MLAIGCIVRHLMWKSLSLTLNFGKRAFEVRLIARSITLQVLTAKCGPYSHDALQEI